MFILNHKLITIIILITIMDPALGYGGLANEIKLFTLMRNSYQ